MSNVITMLQIEEELKKIESITVEERSNVLDKLNDHIDYGGISYDELERVIRELRQEYKISEVDEKYLNNILVDLKN